MCKNYNYENWSRIYDCYKFLNLTLNSFISVWTQTTPEQCQDLEDICTLLQDKGSKQFSRKYSSLPPIIKWFDVLEDSLVVGMWTFLYVQLINFVCWINYLFIILNPCCMKLIITLFFACLSWIFITFNSLTKQQNFVV